MEEASVGIILMLVCGSIAWLCLTEFSYLPGPLQRSVYRWTAPIYEAKWNHDAYSDSSFERLVLSRLRPVLADRPDAVVLDLACGTGRATRAILPQPWFLGRVRAIDASSAMLAVLRGRASAWPTELQNRLEIENRFLAAVGGFPPVAGGFPQADAIILLEAGELLPGFPQIMRQVADMLRPGGIVVLTRPPDYLAWAFFGRRQRSATFFTLLEEAGLTESEEFAWRIRYSIVVARKPPLTTSS
jgi:SAM-dependent methyltransferase